MNNSTKKLKASAFLSLLLTVACATSPESQTPTISTSSTIQQTEEKICDFKPEVPIDLEHASFPMLPDGSGVFYSWFDCRWLGLKCDVYQERRYLFSDRCQMQWFINNGYELMKAPKL